MTATEARRQQDGLDLLRAIGFRLNDLRMTLSSAQESIRV